MERRFGIFISILKTLITVICIVIEMIVFFVLINTLKDLTIDYFWLERAVGVTIAMTVLHKRGNPSYKLSWMMFTIISPLACLILYALWGRDNIPQKLIRHTNHVNILENRKHHKTSMLGNVRRNQSNLIYITSGFAAYSNTSCEYLESGEVMLEKLIAELEKAQKYIFIEFFIIGKGEMWDKIYEVLKRKAAKGVEILIIADFMGSFSRLPRNFAKEMAKINIKVSVFNPIKLFVAALINYRDHRKIIVVDGKVAFNGGINIGDEYINAVKAHGHWKDMAVIVRGEAVWSFCVMFLQMWQLITKSDIDQEEYRAVTQELSAGFVQPFADGPLNKLNIAESVYLQIINSAAKYVYITTPYLILDNEMLTALCLSAKSGVDVRIITPYVPDKKIVHAATRTHYKPLFEAGVAIYEYLPGFMHGKTIVSDDEVCVVGSVNMDYRSFYFNFEAATWACSTGIEFDIKRDFLSTLKKCEKITSASFKKQNVVQKIAEVIIKFLAPLM